jgi:arginyl-tRNA synthetase
VQDLKSQLSARLQPAFAELAGEPTGEPVNPAVRDSEHADFQVDGALALARRLGRNPRETATDIIRRAQLADFCSTVEVSGPGFINLTIADSVIERLLTELAGEAVTRATELVARKSPTLPPDTRAAIAQAVGIGVVKYGDLSTERTTNYVFDWERMLAFDGNTAPYLQYAHARICSILERDQADPPAEVGEIRLGEPAERALALELLRFSGVCAELPVSLEFHHLTGYLYALATTFTRFYEQCRVLQADVDTRQSRLALCHLTARVLRQGLALLGIDAPRRM